MRSLLLFLAFLLAAPNLFALSGGPFDSSSNVSGLDKRRGTYETIVRGSNIIGYTFISASSNLESYGNCRLWVDGATLLGTATAAIEENTCLIMFTARGGSNSLVSYQVSGFLDQKVRSKGYPYRASGEGRLQIITRTFSNLDRLIELGVDLSDITLDDVTIAQLIQLLQELDAAPYDGDAEETRRPIFGKTTQISMLPSALFYSFTDGNGNVVGPIALDPTDVDTFITVVTALNNFQNGNNNQN